MCHGEMRVAGRITVLTTNSIRIELGSCISEVIMHIRSGHINSRHSIIIKQNSYYDCKYGCTMDEICKCRNGGRDANANRQSKNFTVDDKDLPCSKATTCLARRSCSNHKCLHDHMLCRSGKYDYLGWDRLPSEGSCTHHAGSPSGWMVPRATTTRPVARRSL